MGDSVDVREKRQKIVYFDVGGTVFRVFRTTIENYPSSLLAKLVYEFPNLGEEAKPLYVDRSPKAFEWILEIYRNGDFASCVPAVPADVLKRELDFYQLPGIADLGLSDLGCFNQEAETACRCPGKALSEALTKRNLWNSLPLYVWFYRQRPNRQSECGKDLIWLTEQPRDRTVFFLDTMETPLYLSFRACSKEEDLNTWVTAREPGPGGTCYMIRNIAIPAVFRLLHRSAAKYGLCLELPANYSGSVPAPLVVSIAEQNF